MNMEVGDFKGNIERFSGFADVYDRYRPSPPAVLADFLMRWAQTTRLDLVVDLGSGTGLSSRYWAPRARHVIGVEPSTDMRRHAEAATTCANVSYREGLSHQTNLPDHCAQIVTCSQSLHWMEPQSTFQEAARILQQGGVFAACDYDWPPTTGCWQAEDAFAKCITLGREIENADQSKNTVRRWPKNEHLSRMKSSGCFRYCKEVVLHHTDEGNAERFTGLLLSQGGVMSLLKAGMSEAELGIDLFRQVAQSLGHENRTWYWSARVRMGIV